MSTPAPVEEHYGLIRSEVLRVRKFFPPTTIYGSDDLFQEGVMLATKALTTYSQHKGRPSTYLVTALRRHFRDLQERETRRGRYRTGSLRPVLSYQSIDDPTLIKPERLKLERDLALAPEQEARVMLADRLSRWE